MISINRKIKFIAFYLPQFHPIPENNKWWGKGFTEWTNVAQAKPLFKGHHQPNIPKDLGFYDLRLEESRVDQAKMASKYGISGFCYWHYWLGGGKRILEKPIESVLKTKKPNFPFCLGWANHSWTNIWNNEPDKKLLIQKYPGKEDDIDHINYLISVFKDKRYIKVDGKPLFIIFKPNDIPNLIEKIELWKKIAKKSFPEGIYFLGMDMNDIKSGKDLGLDGVIFSTLGVLNNKNKIIDIIKKNFWRISRKTNLGGPQIIDYKELIDLMVPKLDALDVEGYPCIFPNWDNTPRRGKKGLVVYNSKPEYFQKVIEKAVQKISNKKNEKKMIFIKSWNEWAEGNYLEPDYKWGTSFLEILKKFN